MFACVTSLASSLLFLSPVLIMVALVLFAKVRARGEDGESDASSFDPALERELEPVI